MSPEKSNSNADDHNDLESWLGQQSSEQQLANQESLADIVMAIGSSASVTPEGLRAKILGSLGKTNDDLPGAVIADGVRVLRKGDGDWQPTKVAGVETKRLAYDRATQIETLLIRMAAGVKYPLHFHYGLETCYVVSGDMHLGESVLHAGDFQSAVGNSTHAEQWTENGCEVLVSHKLMHSA